MGLLPTSEPAEPDCLELLCEPLLRVRVRVRAWVWLANSHPNPHPHPHPHPHPNLRPLPSPYASRSWIRRRDSWLGKG